jgi:circadian clock protein KaiC
MSDNERNVSSLMDVWVALDDVESNGERNRVLSLL